MRLKPGAFRIQVYIVTANVYAKLRDAKDAETHASVIPSLTLAAEQETHKQVSSSGKKSDLYSRSAHFGRVTEYLMFLNSCKLPCHSVFSFTITLI